MFLEEQTALNFFPAKFDVICKLFGPFHILDLFNDVDIIATLPVGVLRSQGMPTFRKRDQETTTTYSLQYEKKFFLNHYHLLNHYMYLETFLQE